LNPPTLRSEINVTPFVDICLVLLIIFMVITPVLVNGPHVELPEATQAAVGADRGEGAHAPGRPRPPARRQAARARRSARGPAQDPGGQRAPGGPRRPPMPYREVRATARRRERSSALGADLVVDRKSPH
jgi:hypothetical protein